MPDDPTERVVRFFPEFDDIVAALLAELFRRRPDAYEPAVIVGAILFADPATGANEWACAFSSAATITTPMAEILASCVPVVEQLAAAEAARREGS